MKEGESRPNILVVCGKNKKRSRTAEHIYLNDPRINIRSAGLSPKSERKLNEKDLQWADLVLVMEKDQKNKINELYSFIKLPEIINLDIPDEYEFMDEELVEILSDKFNESVFSK